MTVATPRRRRPPTYWVTRICAVLLLLWTIVPIYWIINISLMSPVERLSDPTHLYPHLPTLLNYRQILGFSATDSSGVVQPPSGHSPIILRGLLNSAITSAIVTPITLAVSLTVGYAIGRLKFAGKNWWLFSIIMARSYPPFATLIPFYILFTKIGLMGSYTGLVLLNLSITIPMVIWLMSTFFEGLPRIIEKEARVDGCTRLQAFTRIVLPMSMPGVVVSATISFLLTWNEFTFGLLIGGGTSVQPFAPSIAGLLSVEIGAQSPTLAAAAMVVGLLPSLVLAYIYQKNVRQLNIVSPL